MLTQLNYKIKQHSSRKDIKICENHELQMFSLIPVGANRDMFLILISLDIKEKCKVESKLILFLIKEPYWVIH